MPADYYSTLGVARDASDEQIKKAYRKLAMKWHPDKADDKDAAGKKFREIAEAYDVLADKERRAAFDQYGDAGGAGGGYSFGGDAAEIFGRFFGTANPFEAFALGGGADAGDFAALFGGRGRGLAKGEPATRQLECSLEELYSGCTKTVKVTRKRVGADGKLRDEDTVLEVVVRPGWRAGTAVTFENEGDEVPGAAPSDVSFVVVEKPHERFMRDGDDLVHTARISLKQALTDCTVDVRTLDGRTLSIDCNEIISPGYSKLTRGEGMPVPKSAARGNLVLNFKLVFPDYLSEEKKRALSTLL